MTLVKMNHPARQFNSLLDNFFQDFPGAGNREYNYALQHPPVNIVETSDAYHLEIIAPGRNKEDFAVKLENGQLTISYDKKENEQSKDIKTIRREFSLKSFSRTFSLDEKIEAENIQAKYENGLLKFYLPKKADVKIQPKAIAIQ